MGRGIARVRHPRECGASSGGNDTTLSPVARHFSEPGRKAQNHSCESSAARKNDYPRGNSSDGSIPRLSSSWANDRPAYFCRRRVCAFGSGADLNMANLAPPSDPALTEKRYIAPFILITSLFFLWAFGVNLNDILIPRFKNAFQLSDFQSSFIQVAFFSGYCLAALLAGRLMEKIGYKRGILTGLALCASGVFFFVPASAAGIYVFFFVPFFVMACGKIFLKAAENPYVTILGPADS